MSFVRPIAQLSVLLLRGGKTYVEQIIYRLGRSQGHHFRQHCRRRKERAGPISGSDSELPDEIAKMAKRLSRHGELDFCY